MHILNELKISESTTLVEVDKFPEVDFQKQLKTWLNSDYPFLAWRKELADQEKEKLEKLKKNLNGNYQLRVALLHNNELIGWSFGWQDSSDTFFMGASAIAPEFRRKGLYTNLVSYVLEKTQGLGFQTVSSCHILHNNPVIIAKLKLGFVIRGIEIDPVHGTLLRLNFHHNQLLKSAARFRVGAVGEADVRNLLLSND